MPAEAYFLVSAVFHYLGPAFAVMLFARVQVLGVAWLRIASAAVILAAWRRPWRAFADQDHAGRLLLVGWGAVLAVMNVCFYEAIDRLALGTVAAIEFLPVVALAAVGMRTRRNALALAIAVVGVYLLTHVQFAAEPLGLAFAGLNAALFAVYIVLADRVAKRPGLTGLDGLAGAMLVALVVVTPITARAAAPAFTDPVGLLAGIGVGVSSSVIPYVTDQLALARLPPGHLRADGLAVARDRDRDRHRRADADPDRRAGRRGAPGGGRRRPAPDPGATLLTAIESSDPARRDPAR